VTSRQRLWLFGAGITGFAAFYLWGMFGLPGFGHYPGPYGDVINRVAVKQTNATGVVSAVNFEYRGFDTVGEEFILFVAATGVSLVLRHLRGERERQARDDSLERDDALSTDAIRIAALIFVGPTFVLGWFLASHAQTSPSGGFQGGAGARALSC
jgi:multicomponent Na+:H+ antiporter subunit B